MGWDFSTEPDFQKKLDWVEEFCKNEVEPLFEKDQALRKMADSYAKYIASRT